MLPVQIILLQTRLINLCSAIIFLQLMLLALRPQSKLLQLMILKNITVNTYPLQ